jgi:hypothetical protein
VGHTDYIQAVVSSLTDMALGALPSVSAAVASLASVEPANTSNDSTILYVRSPQWPRNTF